MFMSLVGRLGSRPFSRAIVCTIILLETVVNTFCASTMLADVVGVELAGGSRHGSVEKVYPVRMSGE